MNANHHLRYPNLYVWLVFISAMDIIMTWVVLWHGGYEANLLALAVLMRFGLTGMVLFKLSLVMLFVVICEAVGRRSVSAGRKLATAGVAISSLPVALAFLLLH